MCLIDVVNTADCPGDGGGNACPDKMELSIRLQPFYPFWILKKTLVFLVDDGIGAGLFNARCVSVCTPNVLCLHEGWIDGDFILFLWLLVTCARSSRNGLLGTLHASVR